MSVSMVYMLCAYVSLCALSLYTPIYWGSLQRQTSLPIQAPSFKYPEQMQRLSLHE
jgi:hypothetical protein